MDTGSMPFLERGYCRLSRRIRRASAPKMGSPLQLKIRRQSIHGTFLGVVSHGSSHLCLLNTDAMRVRPFRPILGEWQACNRLGVQLPICFLLNNPASTEKAPGPIMASVTPNVAKRIASLQLPGVQERPIARLGLSAIQPQESRSP